MSPKTPVDKAPSKKNGTKKTPERGLGRGLSSLLGAQGVAIATGMAGVTGAASNGSDIQQTPGTSGGLSLSARREVPI